MQRLLRVQTETESGFPGFSFVNSSMMIDEVTSLISMVVIDDTLHESKEYFVIVDLPIVSVCWMVLLFR